MGKAAKNNGLAFKRAAALAVDIMVGAVFLLPALAGLIMFFSYGDRDIAGKLITVGYYGGSAWLVLYMLFRDAISGQSVGKRIFGLRVVAAGSGKPGNWRHSLVRHGLFWLLSLVGVGLLVEPLMALFHPGGRRLGDLLAKTEVQIVRSPAYH